jgi:two-component system cell cycle sensor histidine kinase/response regulator CckA
MPTKLVLLVDDEVHVRTLVRRVLTRHSYRVVEAGDGEEALALSGQMEVPVDLLLTDVAMPGMDGVELAGRLWATQPGVAVLCMSGACAAEVVQRDILGRGFSFIPKPFRADALVRRVAELLQPAEVRH